MRKIARFSEPLARSKGHRAWEHDEIIVVVSDLLSSGHVYASLWRKQATSNPFAAAPPLTTAPPLRMPVT